MREAEPLTSSYAQIEYYQPRDYERVPKWVKVWLYEWHSPSGLSDIDGVYTERYDDFKSLLKIWTTQGWAFKELES